MSVYLFGLTTNDHLTICDEYRAGVSYLTLAAKYGCSNTTIAKLLKLYRIPIRGKGRPLKSITIKD